MTRITASPGRGSGVGSRSRNGGSGLRSILGTVLIAALLVGTAACVPRSDPGALAPTLRLLDVAGGRVAFQNGIPVPGFGFQPRERLELDGPWRTERIAVDTNLSLTPREASLAAIEAEADGRHAPEFDDGGWTTTPVPGALNPPPDRNQTGGWYRRGFDAPEAWAGRAVTLKFGAVNYLADVWLNGEHLGYHEGGSTPFAFDITEQLVPGDVNVIAVRVDNPTWGTRNDIVPWGLADWWNFAGIIRGVWLEAGDPAQVVRADVTPHLDGADVSVVIENRGAEGRTLAPSVELLAARIDADNVTDPNPAALIADETPIATRDLGPFVLGPGEVRRTDASFSLAVADLWTLAHPALYVIRVRLREGDGIVDEYVDTFGLRRVSVDADGPILRLNGEPVFLAGVAIHDQQIDPPTAASASRGRLSAPADVAAQLDRARSIGARLIRTGHAPANPSMLLLADRLGFAVWEEIPLYHYTPLTFRIAMGRGIPQQMLREMALRDMNRPSVLFHGLANESTGETERTDALRELRDVDRAIDGTRLTGQAAYGFQPEDPSQEPLDVAGYTFYYGVFYGSDAADGTRAALRRAHLAFPAKPIVVLEFGRWADGTNGPELQRGILADTFPPLLAERDTLTDGFVAGAVWWTLEDYFTLRPDLEIEHFGLFRPDGKRRPVADAAAAAFLPILAGELPSTPVVSSAVAIPGSPGVGIGLMLAYVAYGAAVALGQLFVILVVLARGEGGFRPPGAGSRSSEPAVEVDP